ncbi:MarR family transcriptional regulator [Burkholderia cenocepacia]|nr:MarR family transcriptional regulator [Burkholderia cenocepacia]
MSTAETVSSDQLEMTRALAATNDCELSRAIERVTQARAASANGMSTSTMSRNLDKMREAEWHRVLAGLRLQVVPMGSMVVDPHELTALESMALKYLETRRQQRIQDDRP